MPRSTDTHVDKILTQISIAYMQKPEDFFAQEVFPIIGVNKQSDKYFIYSIGDMYRDNMKKRAEKTESEAADFNVSTDNYYCDVWALHVDITDRERANADSPLDLDRDSTEFLAQQGLIRRDALFTAEYLKIGVWGKDITGVSATPTGDQVLQWNDANSDPVGDHKRARVYMKSKTGYRPNVGVYQEEVFEELLEHPDIIDRVKYTATGQGSEALLAQLFRLQKLVVAGSVSNSAVEGATDDIGFIAPKCALLVYAEKKPGIMKPSAGYIFNWKGIGGDKMATRMRKIPLPLIGEGGTRIEIEMAFDMKVVSSDLGYFFTSIIA